MLCRQSLTYDLSINVADFEALNTWQPIAPSRFIPDAPSKLLRAGRFAKDIDIINGWNENDGAIFIFPNITTDAQVIKTIVYPTAPDVNTTNTLLSLYPLSNYAPQKSGNNTATAQFFRASQMWRDTQFLCPGFLLAQANANHSRSASSYFFVMNTTLDTPELEQENKTYSVSFTAATSPSRSTPRPQFRPPRRRRNSSETACRLRGLRLRARATFRMGRCKAPSSPTSPSGGLNQSKIKLYT